MKKALNQRTRRMVKESIDLENIYDAEDAIVDSLGYEEAFNALTKAMNKWDLADLYEYIIRVYDIPFGEDYTESKRPAARKRRIR